MRWIPLILAAALSAPDPAGAEDAYAAAKALEIEAMRLRLALDTGYRPSTTLIEAEDLLARYRRAGPADRAALRAALDLATVRLDLEATARAR